jgi:hypothetical protein
VVVALSIGISFGGFALVYYAGYGGYGPNMRRHVMGAGYGPIYGGFSPGYGSDWYSIQPSQVSPEQAKKLDQREDL